MSDGNNELPVREWLYLAMDASENAKWVDAGKLRMKDQFMHDGIIRISIVWTGLHVEMHTGAHDMIVVDVPMDDPDAVLKEAKKILNGLQWGQITTSKGEVQ